MGQTFEVSRLLITRLDGLMHVPAGKKTKSEGLGSVLHKIINRIHPLDVRLMEHDDTSIEGFQSKDSRKGSGDAPLDSSADFDLGEQKVKLTPDDFEVFKVLGEGAYGTVFKVMHKESGNFYAMKVIKKALLIESEKALENTKSERRFLHVINHPFLVSLKFAFQTKSKLYLVLNLVECGQVFEHLKKLRKFTEEQARIILAEVALGIGHLHSHSLIYRDLKPENLLFDRDGHICLADFGLVKKVDETDGYSHSFCGTREYMATQSFLAFH